MRASRTADVESAAWRHTDRRWDLAQRVASSETFSKSARLSSFLLYVSECAVSGREAEINEQQIGIRVFGRPPGYNSSEDSVVRSQARLLRMRLDVYFQNEGRDEPLVVRIPKGSYIPKFEERLPANPNPVAPFLSRLRFRWMVAAVLAIVLSSAFFVIRSRLHQKPSAPFWSQVFDRKRPTLFVADDVDLVRVQSITHRTVDLSTYLSRSYLRDTGSYSTGVGMHRYTGLPDIIFYSRLSRIPAFDADRTVVRYARDLQVTDVRGANLILVGARRSNPWVELFDQKNTFQGLCDEAHADFVLNRAPRKNEQPIYTPESRPDGGITYGLISFVPGVTGEENVLTIGAINTPGTEGSANFLFSSQFEDFFSKNPGFGSKWRHFEILLRIQSFDGSAERTEILAYRLRSD